MVTLSKLTKEDAKEAAIKFLGILAMWTDCFFDEKAGARLLKIDEESYEGGDIHFECAPPSPLNGYISNSDLSNSVFVRKIEEIFDFAQSGVETECEGGYHLIDLVTELGSFRHLFKSKTTLPLKNDGLDMLSSKAKNGESILDILLAVTDAAYARWKLLEGLPLTLDEIALLAGIGIKTVRNAVSSKGHDRLIVAGREDDKTVVDADEAYRWLLTKKGFTGPFLYHEEPPYNTYETLGQFRHHCYVMRVLANLEISDLAKQLNWNDAASQAYTDLENLEVSERLELLTPNTLLAMVKFYQSKNLNTFVVEGSRILASVIAEYRAKQLFN